MILFRKPFGQFFLVKDSGAENAVSVHSFDGETVLDFNGIPQEISENEILNLDFGKLFEAENSEVLYKETYLKKIPEVIDFIKENEIPKLVFSRKILIDFNEINPGKTFLDLCEKYPNAFVYFFNKNNESWVGAFSETLGKLDKSTGIFTTMSLAGTLPLNENWTEKEIEEQKPVTDFIKNILEKYTSKVEVSETYDHPSANIKHLRNDFKAKINPQDFDKIIADLHPTPAVCGIPKEICLKAIAEFENHNREFYAGFIRVENDEEITCFVNLRCAKISKNRATIFAGGGITAKSNPEKEWNETSLKAEAVMKNLAIS